MRMHVGDLSIFFYPHHWFRRKQTSHRRLVLNHFICLFFEKKIIFYYFKEIDRFSFPSALFLSTPLLALWEQKYSSGPVRKMALLNHCFVILVIE